jgi:sporulation protein YlmC with PRC-barrel domain
MKATRNRLAWLEDLPVVTENGARLGHVFEIRSPGRAETEPTHDERPVECILCGRRGLLERLGWKEPDALAIPWSSVVALHAHAVVVRGPVGSFRKFDAYRAESR